jgi:exodeoxyribonuclease VII large subunit
LFQAVLDREGRELVRLRQEISWLLERSVEHASLALEAFQREVKALSLEGTLARGFALVLDHNHRPIRHVAQVSAELLCLTLIDGTVTVRSNNLTSSTIR